MCCKVKSEVKEDKDPVKPPLLSLFVDGGNARPPVTSSLPHSEPGTMDLGVSKWSTCEYPASSLKFHILFQLLLISVW